jgi:hypothetical protein
MRAVKPESTTRNRLAANRARGFRTSGAAFLNRKGLSGQTLLPEDPIRSRLSTDRPRLAPVWLCPFEKPCTMPAESRNLPEQERSIKAREHELYVKPLPRNGGQLQKPFPAYLRETPAEPLSATTKTILGIVALLVVFVFLAAIWRVSRRHSARSRSKAAPPAAVADYLSSSLEPPVALAVIRYKWTP